LPISVLNFEVHGLRRHIIGPGVTHQLHFPHAGPAVQLNQMKTINLSVKI